MFPGKKRETAEDWVYKGFVLYNQQRFEEAVHAFDNALKINPQRAEIWYNKGNALYNIGRYEDAILAYDRALTLNPDIAEAWNNKGLILYNLKRYEEALDAYSEAIKLNPKYAEAWYNKGNALFGLKRYEEALDAYEMALRFNPNLAEALNNKGLTLYKLQRYDDALGAYTKAVDLNPGYADAWYNIGVVLTELERYEEAVTAFDKAIELNPGFGEAWNNKGLALYELGRYDEALTAYNTAISLNPKLAEAWNNKGIVLPTGEFVRKGHYRKLGQRIMAERRDAEKKEISGELEKVKGMIGALRNAAVVPVNVDEMFNDALQAAEKGNLDGAKRILSELEKILGTIKENAKVEITVELSLEHVEIRQGAWKILRGRIKNKGNCGAEDVKVSIGGDFITKEENFSVGPLSVGAEKDVMIQIKTEEVGELLLEVWVKSRDVLGRESFFSHKFIVNVLPKESVTSILGVDDPLITVLCRYASHEFIGEGRTGKVYKVVKRNGEVVALKYYPQEEMSAERSKQIFKEMEIWETLTKKEVPHVVKLKSINLSPPYIEMEYVGGGSLKKLVKEGKLSNARIANMVYQTIECLIAAYTLCEVIATDLKPSHILVDENGVVKITDWGLCKKVGSLSDSSGYTLAYAAPEQISADRIITPRTLSYLVGSIMYFGFTGKEPYEDEKNIERILTLKINGQKPPMHELPGEMQGLISRCLEPKPKARPALLEIAEELNRIFNLGKDVDSLRNALAKQTPEREFILSMMEKRAKEQILCREMLGLIKELEELGYLRPGHDYTRLQERLEEDKDVVVGEAERRAFLELLKRIKTPMVF
ncbi:MAG: tetratricopeptide repeat protein [Thermoplasmata archaeon]